MKLTNDQVMNAARLARLKLSGAEAAKFQKELSGILNYVEQLAEVDTAGVPPTAQVTGLKNAMRKDEVGKNLLAEPDALLSCSPLPLENRQIKVQKVL